MIEWLIIALALAGLVISFYFTLAYYGRIRQARWVPEILCAREGSSCATVVQTPYARVFGVPNSMLGVTYYLGLVTWLPLRIEVGPGKWYGFLLLMLPIALLVASAVSVVLGFYLVYVLRRKLHIDCPLCYTAHAINAAILVLLLVSAYSG